MTPDQWKVVPLGSLAHVRRGSSPRPIASPRWFDPGSDVGWVRISDLARSNGRVLTDTSQRLSADGISRSRRIAPGTLVMSIAATVGRPVVTGFATCIHDGFVSFERLHGIDRDFLFYVLKGIENSWAAAGQTGSQSNVNTTIVARTEVLIPIEPQEQKGIASTLSDVDDLIATLEQLIAKKDAIKQGMMQQLLTGRTRLFGFSGPWHERRLSDMLSYEQPGKFIVHTTKQLERGRVPVLTAGKTFVLGYTNDTDGIYKAHPVIIFDDFTTSSKFVDFDFKVKSSAMKILSAKPGTDVRFLFERMQLIDFPLGDHKRHWISEYGQQEIEVPGRTEQSAIAKVLRDPQDEIASLASRLQKAKAMKEGMMQELLTGRTRLPRARAVS